MLSKNKIKLIRSLSLKKFRDIEKLFVAEGKKLVLDLIDAGMQPIELYCTPAGSKLLHGRKKIQVIQISEEEITKISNLKSPPEMIALFEIDKKDPDWRDMATDISLVLDNVQDPGNLGTIVRLADWFGIRQIFCSPGSADLYNPKAVQSTMGALARVSIIYLPLDDLFEKAAQLSLPVYGTFMEGENIFQASLTTNGLIVMGNEGNGISSAYHTFINRKLTIPSFPAGATTAESLNVSVATAIACAEFRRRVYR